MSRRTLSFARLVFITLLLALQLALARQAKATLTLTLDDGIPADLKTITSNTGLVTYFGSVGSNWTVNVTTGLSAPMSGSTNFPEMDLASIDLSGGPGTLTITLTDNNFTGSGLTDFKSEIGGTLASGAGNSLEFITSLNGTKLFDTTLTSSPFASAAIDPMNIASSPYSLSIETIFTQNDAGPTSFDASITDVPEPSTLLLAGFGLVGVAGWTRRRSKRKS